jgi:branched-chain amino acid transport system ATP-binding protein
MTEVLGQFPRLGERIDRLAGDLSGGEQQMLTLAQAFLARPRLLMIDELSLGLAPLVVQELLRIVEAINAQGTTVILVEQSVNVALTVCQRAVFLEKGEVRFEGRAADLLDRPDLLRSVFLEGAAGVVDIPGTRRRGARASSVVRVPARSSKPDELATQPRVLLEAQELRKVFGGIVAVDGLNLQLHDNEILGVIGSNGAGKTTAFDILTGTLRPDAGRVIFNGADVTHRGAAARARAGLGRSFQDARLFPSLTVEEAIAVALERHLDTRDPLGAVLHLPLARDSEAATRRRVMELIDLMNLGAYRDKFIAELSTGSRRVVDVACAMAHNPAVLLLDEPSSGIAQRETEALGPLLVRLQQETNMSILLIEHDMPLVSSIADRLIALEAGRQIAIGAVADVLHDPRVLSSYLGTDETLIARSGALVAATRVVGIPEEPRR